MPPPFDYRKLRLHKDGSIVDDVRMLWSAIEQFSNAACGKGCNTLRDSRAMPFSVEVDLAYRGRCEVLLHNEERAAAISIGQAIGLKLHGDGYGVRRPAACVSVALLSCGVLLSCVAVLMAQCVSGVLF